MFCNYVFMQYNEQKVHKMPLLIEFADILNLCFKSNKIATTPLYDRFATVSTTNLLQKSCNIIFEQYIS